MSEEYRLPPRPTQEEGAKKMAEQCCSREQTAREVLTEHVRQLEETLRQLHALLNALPVELPQLADRALKRILRPDRFQ